MNAEKVLDCNLENVFHSLALEYAKDELANKVKESKEKLSPEEKVECLYHGYFVAYGKLKRTSKDLFVDAYLHTSGH